MGNFDRILAALRSRNADCHGSALPVIACLGDSVTHGCFEVGMTPTGELSEIYDSEAVYHARLRAQLYERFPKSAVAVINAGISGDNAAGALARLARDVTAFRPQLVIVCLGLNDVHSRDVDAYAASLREILERVSYADRLLLLPNCMNRRVSDAIVEEGLRQIAERCMQLQRDGTMDRYMQAARAVAASLSVPVYDAYAQFAAQAARGVDTDSLLANHINHPLREVHAVWGRDIAQMIREDETA